jgi:uroporphyrinogen-III decarboxylase
MTPRQRWLAALGLQPLDRLPFWPKLDAAYLRAWGRWGSLADAHACIGSDRHEWVPSCVKETRSVTRAEVESDGAVMRTVYHTPSGALTATQLFDPVSVSWHPREFPVKSVEDLRAMTEWFADARRDLDAAALDAARTACAATGDDAPTAVALGESPLMYFVEWLAGIENAHLLLADHQSEVEALFDAIHRGILERARIELAHSPADFFYLGENTSTTLISPDQYRGYCLPHIGEYARLAVEHGRPLVLHMCGKLKALLPDIDTLPVAGFEAFTSPPVGDCTLLDGRSACPGKCLIGGTNATLWLRPAREIIGEIEGHLDEMPHHRGIVVTSGGVMPPACNPETIREVCDWVKAYPVRT